VERATALRVGLLSAALLLSLPVGVFTLERAMLFPRPLDPPPDVGQGSVIPGLERWWRDVPGGRVEAWYIPAPGASAEAPGPLVLYAHGNGGTIDHVALTLLPYLELGVSVLLPEFRGHGRSDGRPGQAAITEDLSVFLDRALVKPVVDEDRVLYHGRSLGGGAVCSLARRYPPQALLLESTFTGARRRGQELFGPLAWLVRNPFDNQALVEGFDGPVLVIHGEQDEVIPYAHGRALAQAAPRSRLVTRQAHHADLPRDAAYWAEVQALMEDAGF
jgi:pimeloyl-ACP methyl ester carboxylesterase